LDIVEYAVQEGEWVVLKQVKQLQGLFLREYQIEEKQEEKNRRTPGEHKGE